MCTPSAPHSEIKNLVLTCIGSDLSIARIEMQQGLLHHCSSLPLLRHCQSEPLLLELCLPSVWPLDCPSIIIDRAVWRLFTLDDCMSRHTTSIAQPLEICICAFLSHMAHPEALETLQESGSLLQWSIPTSTPVNCQWACWSDVYAFSINTCTPLCLNDGRRVLLQLEFSPWSLIDILSVFLQISHFFSKYLLRILIKLQLKFTQISISVYLKILVWVSEVFLIFFWHSNYFSKKINCQ